MPRVIHFEFAADNPERAAKFYREIFGWESSQWGGPMNYWLVKTGAEGPGIDGGILQYQEKMPRTINSVEVDSGVGYQAYFLDTEGNVFGVFQADPAAK
jgi:predicted enzyme related to lactoylglutathione lyase